VAQRILFATGALYTSPLRTVLALARDAGCDGVELDVSPEVMLRPPHALARLSAQSDMPICALHPPLFPLPGWRHEREVLSRLPELALALGIPTIVVHPPKALPAEDARLNAFAEQLNLAQRRLQGSGSEITLENPGFFRPRDHLYPCWHLPTLRRLAGRCGVRMTLDTTHAGSSPYSLLESYDMVRERLAHVHLSDHRPPPRWLDRPWLDTYVKHHQLPGEGTLPLAAFLQALVRDGFDGDIALELSPLSLEIWSLARARDHLREAVLATRRMLAGRP